MNYARSMPLPPARADLSFTPNSSTHIGRVFTRGASAPAPPALTPMGGSRGRTLSASRRGSFSASGMGGAVVHATFACCPGRMARLERAHAIPRFRTHAWHDPITRARLAAVAYLGGRAAQVARLGGGTGTTASERSGARLPSRANEADAHTAPAASRMGRWRSDALGRGLEWIRSRAAGGSKQGQPRIQGGPGCQTSAEQLSRSRRASVCRR
mmetsp:Transcript_17497/g.44838  ORF Transcript_17497/g.44838 Transcript_17497/m.44838 type:complete len:213 (+) Transcript_17497:582-1220(+)